ncbi:hypothetical protein AMATHDRAFT_48727 [Amanita thiersii Skay4041]|uniref:C3H1-type domain-containing protein n=1 Tax=Amanita thiersii Skay4041 TaxID=703135 RepID=A0A2A9NEG7_9AGAR|nr:hypothetical protein AMATHDRAFT_48727 [Amanita thiersii Skay4041]
MPAQDTHVESDRDRDKDKDRDYDNYEKSDRTERGGNKQKLSSSQKAKDLSHVPCKFFKVGACTAGSSCPFSHVVPEPGQKEVCAWFVKGNCKFGHKCALAHILPGQGMAMDRKNKKAAQQAAAAVTATEKGIGMKDGPKDNGGKGGNVRRREGHHPGSSVSGHGGSQSVSSGQHSGSGRNTTLLTGGSTAPTRLLQPSSSSSSSRSPMPLRASISPSVPAPPVKDTDFTSFAALDEMEGVDLPSQRGGEGEKNQGASSEVTPDTEAARVIDANQNEANASNASTHEGSGPKNKTTSKPASPVPLPTSAPRPPAPSVPTGFGPIGSPPSAARLNGGTASRTGVTDISLSPPSERNASAQSFLPSSPFSAPGAQSVFLSSSLSGHGDANTGLSYIGGQTSKYTGQFGAGGVAASLGTGLALRGGNDGFDDFNIGKGARLKPGLTIGGTSTEHAVDDGEMEDFIPSSLSDLLTPEERKRRMSRSGQQQPQFQPPATGLTPSSRLPVTDASQGPLLGHRYSRSVPAPSLLGELRSIWSDTNNSNASTQRKGTPLASDRFDNVTPQTGGISGNKPNLNGGSNNLLTDDMGLSMSMGSSSSFGGHLNTGMSPSNASAAFLPGLHHHYSKARQHTQSGLTVSGGSMAGVGNRATSGVPSGTGQARGLRTASGPLFPGMSIANYGGSVGVHTHAGTTQTYRTTPSPFDLTQPQHQHHNSSSIGIGAGGGRGLGVGGNVDDPLVGNYLSSPSARALQAHAPGQSLPQGLAAGLSRIHALPPLPTLTSPGTSLSEAGGLPMGGPYGEWKGSESSASNNIVSGLYAASSTTPGTQLSTANGANAIDSMLSRMTYSAVARSSAGAPGVTTSPPGLSKGAGRYQHAAGSTLSPLSRPATDDDELFAMDG